MMHFDMICGLYGGVKTLVIVLMCAGSYFLGNINTATILAKKRGLDIKEEGSGNAGTTNALRVLGKKAAVLTLVIDIGKGVAAVLIAREIGGEGLAMMCALCVYIGHVWPLIYKFRGGKGVATAFGAFTALSPPMGFTVLGVVAVCVLISKRMSVGSIIGAAVFPFIAWIFKPEFVPIGTVMAIIVFFKHWQNIIRLKNGEEPKLSFGKRKEGE